jgi:hypothetical protein
MPDSRRIALDESRNRGSVQVVVVVVGENDRIDGR